MEDSSGLVIDEAYEFSAPRYFDFVKGESEEDAREAEIWFDIGISYAPSPFMPKIKISRSSIVATLCDFNEAGQLTKQESESSESIDPANIPLKTMPRVDVIPSEIKNKDEASLPEPEKETKTSLVDLVQVKKIELHEETSSVLAGTASVIVRTQSKIEQDTHQVQPFTPKQLMNSQKVDKLLSESKKRKSAQKIANLVRNPSALRSKMKSSKPTNVKINGGTTPSLAQENQAIKRQKLEGGKSRQILHVKPQILPHKSRLGRTSGMCKLNFSSAERRKEDRKVYVRERAAAAPFISAAEMMKKFQSSTREMSISNIKPLTLTRPKEPDFETSQRIRFTKIKSTAELEEEMMAKIPRFKARPVNKKILEASTLPPLPRSTPHIPEFQEFHFETMARTTKVETANKNAETSTVVSSESYHKNHQLKFHLTQPKSPRLQTSLRARSTTVKSSFDLELEEIEKAPKFKARPLNKKIFESKGELGMFCNTKKQVTIPQEFHFATDARIPQPVTVFDLFDKISLNSESRPDHLTSRITTLNPFNLHTEARGVEKGRRFVGQVTQKQLEEEKARIHKAKPYPCTTDFPVVPPKPEPKHATNPKPFRLESLARHEEETRKYMEERKRLEKEEAEMRLFKAQPIMKEDPIPVPEKVRKPLTEVQEFSLNVNNRAVERFEFDKKIKEKEIIHKRYRDESESSRMMEEEKALKQMRRTMVPQARPLPKCDQPFMPRKTLKETTIAKSPNLRVLRRKDARRITATSSSAANMR